MEKVPAHLGAVLDKIDTPAYVADVAAMKRNLAVVDRVRREAGCKVLLATKSFALPAVFPIMKSHLDGTTASGLYEARLGKEEFGKEVHVYSPAYTENEVQELLKVADNIYFNSVSQVQRFLPVVRAAGKQKKVGIRINPGYSKANIGGDLYNPCAPRSRFGVIKEQLDQLPWDEIDVLHAHVLCESLHDGSVELIKTIDEQFGKYVGRVNEVNFGGGHIMNKPGYDVDALIAAIKNFRAKYPNVDVVLEPGGGIVYDTGYLVATVLDVLHNTREIAVLDTSASCHMPDVIIAHWVPPVVGAEAVDEEELEKSGKPIPPNTYILGGKTCMTGDVIGSFAFQKPLRPGDKIVFSDMMQYNLVQSHFFNGTPHPDVAVLHEDGRYEVVRKFGYDDFRNKFGGPSKIQDFSLA